MITIYLDSSDFSRLSKWRDDEKIGLVREELLELARRQDIKFVFSGAHISEMAPLKSDYTESAVARSESLTELCGSNALIDYASLMDAEIEALSNRETINLDIHRNDGSWFPPFEDIAPVIDLVGAFKDAISGISGINRQQRRYVKSKAMRKGKLRKGVADLSPEMDLGEILEKYPMREDDMRILSDYAMGKATSRQANEAFLASLRDPRWMMQWFQEHYDRLGPVGELVRGPARRIVGSFGNLIDASEKAKRLKNETGIDCTNGVFSSESWSAMQDNLVLKAVNSTMSLRFPGARLVQNAADVDQFCPGFSCCIRTIHSSLRNSVGESSRQLKESDFVDAIHAMYAPYVDIFRADRYMTPIVSRFASTRGATVVDKLESVCKTIAMKSMR